MVAMMAAQHPPPPISTPAMAPRQVRLRHQIPSTSSGQNDDAAIAKAQPTRMLAEKFSTASAATTATAPAPSAHQRNDRTPPRSTSWERAPPPVPSSPEGVDRRAARAPAATSAASAVPAGPGSSSEGS